jgi:hypothetical protein
MDALAKSLGDHDQKVKRYIAAQFIRAAGEDAPNYMKRNAPWSDISGNARAGLHATAKSIDQGKAFELIAAHSVFYGIYLESRFSGKFAILMPTINYIGKLLIDRIAAGLEKL